MKRIILIALIAASASTVQAQGQAPAGDIENAVRISAPQPTIELPAKPHHLFRGDFDVYRGTYSLSNGEEMTLRQQGRRIFATLTGRAEKELVASARNVFVAKDRDLKITLVADTFTDQITGEVLIRHPRKLADVEMGKDAPIERLAVR